MQHLVTSLTRFQWKTVNGTKGQLHLTGRPFLDGHLMSIDVLEKQLSNLSSRADYLSLLGRIDGFYSLIWVTPFVIMVSVDIVRSKPIFYRIDDRRLIFSDDPEFIRLTGGASTIAPTAVDEFRYTGYVTGRDTLLTGMKQIQAGEMLFVDRTASDSDPTFSDHFCFIRYEHDATTHSTLLERLNDTIQSATLKLIDYAAGRTIVVPLSGGYDSRTIVMTLKLLGYDNVLCFSYGMPNNPEATVSELVARTLNYPWYFTEYNEFKWARLWQDELRWRYQFEACSWSTLPVLQDFLAVRELLHGGVLPPDCVVAPGHSADFSAGSHTPGAAFRRTRITMDTAVDEVLLKHYSLQRSKVTELRQKWTPRVETHLSRFTIDCGEGLAKACDYWNWRERQSKYIANSCRAYDFFCIDWFMPFWTREYNTFWLNTPLLERRGRRLQLEHLSDVLAPSLSMGDFLSALGNATTNTSIGRMTSMLRAQAKLHIPDAIKGALSDFWSHHLSRGTLHQQSHFLLSGYDRTKVDAAHRDGVSVFGAHANFLIDDLLRLQPLE